MLKENNSFYRTYLAINTVGITNNYIINNLGEQIQGL